MLLNGNDLDTVFQDMPSCVIRGLVDVRSSSSSTKVAGCMCTGIHGPGGHLENGATDSRKLVLGSADNV